MGNPAPKYQGQRPYLLSIQQKIHGSYKLLLNIDLSVRLLWKSCQRSSEILQLQDLPFFLQNVKKNQPQRLTRPPGELHPACKSPEENVHLRNAHRKASEGPRSRPQERHHPHLKENFIIYFFQLTMKLRTQQGIFRKMGRETETGEYNLQHSTENSSIPYAEKNRKFVLIDTYSHNIEASLREKTAASQGNS